MNLDRSLVADLSTTSRAGGGGGGRVLRSRHSLAGGHGQSAGATNTTSEATGMMQRLRALNAGARLNTLEQCSTPLATQGKGYVSIGMKRHSMSARLNRSQDKRARPSLAPGALLGSSTTTVSSQQQPQPPASSSGSASVVVSAKAQGQGLVSANGSGPFSFQPQDQQQTIVGPFTTAPVPSSSATTSATATATTSIGSKVELPELFATVALDTPFYHAQSSSAVVTSLDHVLNSEEFTDRSEVLSTHPITQPIYASYQHTISTYPFTHPFTQPINASSHPHPLSSGPRGRLCSDGRIPPRSQQRGELLHGERGGHDDHVVGVARQRCCSGFRRLVARRNTGEPLLHCARLKIYIP